MLEVEPTGRHTTTGRELAETGIPFRRHRVDMSLCLDHTVVLCRDIILRH